MGRGGGKAEQEGVCGWEGAGGGEPPPPKPMLSHAASPRR